MKKIYNNLINKYGFKKVYQVTIGVVVVIFVIIAAVMKNL